MSDADDEDWRGYCVKCGFKVSEHDENEAPLCDEFVGEDEIRKAERKRILEKVRPMIELIKQIDKNHDWYIKRGGLLPYGWSEYMGTRLRMLAKNNKDLEKLLEG